MKSRLPRLPQCGLAGLLVDVADDEERRAEDGDHVGDQRPGQQLGEHLHVVERRRPQLEAPRRLLAAGDEEVAVEPERVLGRDVGLALGDLEHLGKALVDRPGGHRPEDRQAVLDEVEADVDLLEQHLEPRQAVAGGAGDDPAGPVLGEQLAIREVGLVAAQVDVHAGGAGDRDRTRRRPDGRRVEDPDPAGARGEDLVADEHRLEVGQPAAHGLDGVVDPAEPPGGHVLLEATDPVEHVVHAPAGASSMTAWISSRSRKA